MNLRNYPECGKLFIFTTKNLCRDCIEQEEADFVLIKDYLMKNHAAGIPEISRDTGVSSKRVISMLHDKRLIAVCEIYDIKLLQCERCGKPNINGRFCPEYSDSLGKLCSELAINTLASQTDIDHTRPRKSVFTEHFRR